MSAIRILAAGLVGLLAAVILGQTAYVQERVRKTPSPEVQQRVRAVLDAVNGDNAAVDKLVKEHFTPEYAAARTPEERRQWFEPLRARLGKIEVEMLRRRDAETVVMLVIGQKEKAALVLTLDEKTSLIKGLGVEEPGSGQ